MNRINEYLSAFGEPEEFVIDSEKLQSLFRELYDKIMENLDIAWENCEIERIPVSQIDSTFESFGVVLPKKEK
jgi:hypothetical protein